MASQPHKPHLSDLPELSDFRAGLRNAADAFRAFALVFDFSGVPSPP